MRWVVVGIVLGTSASARAWDTAQPVWCGSSVAAGAQSEVVIASAGTTHRVATAATPLLLGWNADCSKLAVVTDHVGVIDTASATLTDLGAIPTLLRVHPNVPISWSPLGAAFAVAFYTNNVRGNDVIQVHDAAARTSTRLVLPAGEVDQIELEAPDRATVAMKVGTIFGPDSLVATTTAGWRAISTRTYKELFFARHVGVGQASTGDVVSIDLKTSAERLLVAHAQRLHGISPDASRAIVSEDNGPNHRRVESATLARGALTRFTLETYDPAWSADGTILVGTSATRTGAAASHSILYADDGRAGPWPVYDAGPYGGAVKGMSHFAVSADGARVAFVAVTNSAHHTVAVCGDWSWDEHHELVVVPVAAALRATPPVTVPLANTVGCAWE